MNKCRAETDKHIGTPSSHSAERQRGDATVSVSYENLSFPLQIQLLQEFIKEEVSLTQ